MIHAHSRTGALASPLRILVYTGLLAAGLLTLYSLLLALTAASVWTIRHEETFEVWFYAIQLAAYPDDVYRKDMIGASLSFVLTFVLPIFLAVNVPARYGAMLLGSWKLVAYLFLVAFLSAVASRRFFRFSVRSYQSASS